MELGKAALCVFILGMWYLYLGVLKHVWVWVCGMRTRHEEGRLLGSFPHSGNQHQGEIPNQGWVPLTKILTPETDGVCDRRIKTQSPRTLNPQVGSVLTESAVFIRRVQQKTWLLDFDLSPNVCLVFRAKHFVLCLCEVLPGKQCTFCIEHAMFYSICCVKESRMT